MRYLMESDPNHQRRGLWVTPCRKDVKGTDYTSTQTCRRLAWASPHVHKVWARTQQQLAYLLAVRNIAPVLRHSDLNQAKVPLAVPLHWDRNREALQGLVPLILRLFLSKEQVRDLWWLSA